MHYNLPAATFMRTVRIADGYNGGNGGATDVQVSGVIFDPQSGSRVVLTSLRVHWAIAAVESIMVGFGTLPLIAHATVSLISSNVALDLPALAIGVGNVEIGNGQGIIGYGAKDASLTMSTTEIASGDYIVITATGYQEDASSE